MDVEGVARELRRLNEPPPPFNPERDEHSQVLEWQAWSAGEMLVVKWEEQASKRTAGAEERKKAARSTSTTGPRSRDYIGR